MRHGLMVMLWTQGTDNNMNEEWFGSHPTNARGPYDLIHVRLIMY
jgi:hypothetical protein